MFAKDDKGAPSDRTWSICYNARPDPTVAISGLAGISTRRQGLNIPARIANLAWLLVLLVTTTSCGQSGGPWGGRECRQDTLRGEFVGRGDMALGSAGGGPAATSRLQAVFQFDGTDVVTVRDGLSSEGGNNVSWEGSGRYMLASDCTGTMHLEARVAGGIDARMNFDFLVSGTGRDTSISSLFVVHPGATSGQFELRPR